MASGRTQPLRSRVAWRVLALFALTSLAPIFLTAQLSYRQSTEALREAVLVHLRDQAKTEGLRLLRQLDSVAVDGRNALAAQAEEGRFDPARLGQLGRHLRSVVRVDAAGGIEPVFGETDVEGIRQAAAAARGDRLDPSIVVTRSDHAPAINYVYEPRSAVSQPAQYVLTYSDSLFFVAADYLSSRTAICLFTDDAELLSCSDENLSAIAESPVIADVGSPNDGLSWSLGDAEHLSATWTLFLKAKYGAPSINVAAIADRNLAFEPMRGYQSAFPAVLLLVAILVCVAAYRVVRGSLVPLQELTRVTADFAEGRLETRADIRTGDEFQDVGDAFNDMAANLHAQFDTLRSIAAIDRMIADSVAVERLSEVFIRRALHIRCIEAAVVLILDRENPATAEMYGGQTPGTGSMTITTSESFRNFIASSESTAWMPIHEAGIDRKIRAQLGGLPLILPLPIMFDNVCKGVAILGASTDECLTPGLLDQLRDLAAHLGVGIASTEREEDLYRQAHYDGLTGLPNRQLLRDRVSQAVKLTVHDGGFGAMLFLDLDRFKSINDVFGHSAGDFVLKEAAIRVLDEVWDGCTVARLGGDEFVILVPSVDDDLQIDELASRIVSELSRPFEVQGDEQYLGASVGVVIFPADGESFETLLRNADAAMYRAKEAGRSRYEYFSEKLNAANQRRIVIERDLRRALVAGNLELHYQPQFSMDSKELRGAEALVRWVHPTWGPISPTEFIPIAESSDLIVDLGFWVLDQACRDMRRLLDAGVHPGTISINVSARQLRDPRIASRFAGILSKHRINPGFLELEITESVVAQNKDTAIGILGRLRSIGFKVAMDDFGTGYSSLSYFQQLPFDSLKIDQSFVRELGSDENAENICKAIISMSKQLGKVVIAEGIESDKQAHFLRVNDCEVGQGFYFARPLPFDDFLSFVGKQTDHTLRRKALEIV